MKMEKSIATYVAVVAATLLLPWLAVVAQSPFAAQNPQLTINANGVSGATLWESRFEKIERVDFLTHHEAFHVAIRLHVENLGPMLLYHMKNSPDGSGIIEEITEVQEDYYKPADIIATVRSPLEEGKADKPIKLWRLLKCANGMGIVAATPGKCVLHAARVLRFAAGKCKCEECGSTTDKNDPKKLTPIDGLEYNKAVMNRWRVQNLGTGLSNYKKAVATKALGTVQLRTAKLAELKNGVAGMEQLFPSPKDSHGIAMLSELEKTTP